MDPAYVATHLEEEQRHWWFQGRLAVLRSVLRATLPPGRLRIVEIGCGGGALLALSAEFGEVVGVEVTEAFLDAARRRGLPVLRGSLPDALPLDPDSFDGVFLFDVLEHIEDDRAALRAVRRILKPGGLLICTGPAYPWLWGPHDEVLGHRRRYTARTLRQVALDADLRLLRVTYFNTLLAPAIVLVRALRRRRYRPSDVGIPGGRPPAHDLVRPAPVLNALFARIFAWEAGLLRWVNLPFGISVLMVACRPPREGPL